VETQVVASTMPFLVRAYQEQETAEGAGATRPVRAYEYGVEFKVVVTNKELQASGVLDYHDGRGSQEGVFAELKTHCHMDYVPVRTQLGKATYLLAALFAFNLTRELQMQNREPDRNATRNRATLWFFEKVDTIRRTTLQRAGRLSRPTGRLTLTFCA